jgi:hypothetical protein
MAQTGNHRYLATRRITGKTMSDHHILDYVHLSAHKTTRADEAALHEAIETKWGHTIAASDNLKHLLIALIQAELRGLHAALMAAPDANWIEDPWQFLDFSIERHRFACDRLSMPTLMAKWRKPDHKIPVAGLIKTFMVDATEELPLAINYVKRNGFARKRPRQETLHQISDGAPA